MLLHLEDGKSLPDAYKEYLIATLIATRKWRRDLIAHWIENSGKAPIKVINGKDYWGGEFDIRDPLTNSARAKMLDLLGMDKAGQTDIQNIAGEDWCVAGFRPLPKIENPYSIDNFLYMFRNGFSPTAAAKGLSTVTFKSIDVIVPVVYVDGVADDPMSHVPEALAMKGRSKTDPAYSNNFSPDNTFYDRGDLYFAPNDLKVSGLHEAFAAIYAMSDFFETHVAHSISVQHVGTSEYMLMPSRSYWTFQTWDTFVMGDYTWMGDAEITALYNLVKIGESKEEDYFSFGVLDGISFKGRNSADASGVAKNLSGLVMDIVDPSTGGESALAIALAANRSPYAWAVSDGTWLWFDKEYIMNMDIKEFAYLMAIHLDIRAGADDGFFGTFIGGFVGAFIGLVSNMLDVFFKIVEAIDFVTKSLINAILKHVFKLNDNDRIKLMSAYTEIRNQIALIVVTQGIGAYLEGASIAAEASAAMEAGGGAALTAAETEMVIAGSIEASFATIGGMELAGYGLQIGMAGFNGFNAVDTGTATASAVEESVRSANPMQLVYGESDIDFVDAVYVMMGDPMMMVERENNVLDVVYG